MGNAVVEKARGVGIESTHPLSSVLVNSFNKAGLKTRPYSNREALKWSKLLTNLQANAIPAILNWTPLEVLSNVQTYALECAAIREAVDVMQALKISVVDLPGTPVRVLVNAMTRWPQWFSRPLIARTLGAARGGKMPSLQMDLTAGRKQSEVEFLNGAVVRAAERAGLPAPVNQALTQRLSGMAAGGIPPRRMQSHPEQILRYIMEQL
jgi:2-dehydropantoate 2-reductase